MRRPDGPGALLVVIGSRGDSPRDVHALQDPLGIGDVATKLPCVLDIGRPTHTSSARHMEFQAPQGGVVELYHRNLCIAAGRLGAI